MLGLDWNTPSYIVREETKAQLLRIETGKRAVSFEEKNREKSNNKILIECFREVEKNKETQNRWEIEKYIFEEMECQE